VPSEGLGDAFFYLAENGRIDSALEVFRMKERPAVALLIETSNAYARGLLEGITSYVRAHDPWSIYLPEQGRGAAPPTWLARWRGDGMIARIETEEIAAAIRRAGVPVIDVSAARLEPTVPWVETDDAAIAQLAAEHLLERGFRHLAFCGETRFNWSKWRGEHFIRHVRQAGFDCHVYQSPGRGGRGRTWDEEHQALLAWVRALPRPVGVMACYDIKAQQLLDACREAGVMVPEELAVIGVDNDCLLCNLASPPLSSVIPDAPRAGYLAAGLLDHLLAGGSVAAEAHLLAPLGVATRQSTDIFAIDDRDIAAAIRLIREHACDGLNVAELLRSVPLSRRVLEARFRKAIGRTPHEEILRVKIARVKQLLVGTSLTLPAIAQRTGFPHAEYLSVAFKREVGQSPRDFRVNHGVAETRSTE
jgi:LacI family transcriptional regulator